jgi:hypothetical protein
MVKRPESEAADHSSSASAEVKNWESLFPMTLLLSTKTTLLKI